MRVSVVVRCVGREQLFNGVLDCLQRQTIAPSQTLVVMDSNNSGEIKYVDAHLKTYANSSLLIFEHEDFSHPYSANLGMAFADEELVCLTNGHSLPISLYWLERGLKHFEDQNVAGVGGFFFPSKKGLARTLFYVVEAQMRTISWLSTINCIIRKSRWKEYPFDQRLLKIIPETEKYGGEDYDWTLEMLSRGYKIILDPDFSVVHFHQEGIMLETCRNLRNYFIYKRLREKIKKLERPRKAFRFPRKHHLVNRDLSHFAKANQR